ncbi:hypothetical protein BU17DRAFT_44855 [Hysterangium stoloniferum]|nr:hypothetical protein BU17DRAFT_44855 [Hysterangium stoloniferum]
MATSIPAPTQDLDLLFPLPTRPPSVLSPSTPLGITQESARALVRLLKENHVKFHCFFNDTRFHNHLSHHLLAAYYLGANPALLQEAYEYHAAYQRAAYSSPAPIDIKNWKDHLGDEDYYNAYLAFFSAELVKNGLEQSLETFIFSDDANWGSKSSDKHPEMVSRVLAGLLHPFIFIGHGVEFGQLGMVAEGLAQTAAHHITTSNLITREFLASPSIFESLAASLTHRLNITYVDTKETNPLKILALVLKDPRLGPGRKDSDETRYFDTTIKEKGSLLLEYAQQWEADTSSSAAVSQRIEEMAWVVSIIYGIGGCRKDKPFKADFFAMHLVTSSLFLPSFVVHLKSASARTFLRSYFAVVLGYWVSQGRPTFDITNFYAATSSTDPPGEKPTPNPRTLDKENVFPNTWYPLLQSTLMHPGEHLLKLERALAHYASLYGTTPKNHFKDVDLDGIEELDGTLFLRAAWLSLNRNGWMREGDEEGGWDFDGFHDE